MAGMPALDTSFVSVGDVDTSIDTIDLDMSSEESMMQDAPTIAAVRPGVVGDEREARHGLAKHKNHRNTVDNKENHHLDQSSSYHLPMSARAMTSRFVSPSPALSAALGASPAQRRLFQKDASAPSSASKKSKFDTRFPLSSVMGPAASPQLQPAKLPRQAELAHDETQPQSRSLDEEEEFDEDPNGTADDSSCFIGDDRLTHAHVDAPAPVPSPHAHPFDDQIRLNVGGILFQTTLQTLLIDHDSYFCLRFSGRFIEHPSPFDGSFFIDRDGTHFRHLLNWMRDRTLFVSDLDTLQQLHREAEFYMLHALARHIAEKVSDINISRMRLDGGAAPDRPIALHQPPIQPPTSFMQNMLFGRAPVPHHRNLFTTHWGMGGMGGVGPTVVTASNWNGVGAAATAAASPFTTVVKPKVAHSSQMTHFSVHMPSSLPTRTASCPSASDAWSSDTSCGSFQPATPVLQPCFTPVLHHRQDNLAHHFTDADVDRARVEPVMSTGQQHGGFVFSLEEDF